MNVDMKTVNNIANFEREHVRADKDHVKEGQYPSVVMGWSTTREESWPQYAGPHVYTCTMMLSTPFGNTHTSWSSAAKS